MVQQLSLKLKPQEAADDNAIKSCIANALGKKQTEVTGYYKIKQSIDARSKQQIWLNVTLQAYINEPFVQRPMAQVQLKDVTNAPKKVIIIGAGPAGFFAAIKLAEVGIQPIIIERGKDVRARRRDLAQLNREGIVNPESNYCFGEGGAGTYSDGKLYTRSTKRGDINRILNLFVQFGADENICYEAHPHIGTNKLPHIITAMREAICAAGGQFYFDQKVTKLITAQSKVKAVQTQTGDVFEADAVIIATGHSARDIFTLLHQQNILIEAKPFALGVRAEHPQSLIDTIQYHAPQRDAALPPSSYGWVEQANGKGVFSFCMCPGGIIAPAATSPGELVVNGWSPSKRNNPYANSGIVVTVDEKDAYRYLKKEYPTLLNSLASSSNEVSPLLLMHFQQMVEQKAFAAGGGGFVAPAQRMVDFCNGTISNSLPQNSYIPGLVSADLKNVLPSFIHTALQEGFKAFGKKRKGYYTNDAVLVATESRTSSPVRIPRNNDTLQHPQFNNLYPCGEGAGYAGGIVSAAMDGERVATMIEHILLG